MTRKTKRIYHGPDEDPTAAWWDVAWSPATKSVVINGTLEHAINGAPGLSIGCRLSNAATDEINAKAFPHPAYIAAFYKSIALVVDKLAKNGTPIHAVAYGHSYGDFIDLNDASNLEPIYKDRRFHLRVPQDQSKPKKPPTDPSNESSTATEHDGATPKENTSNGEGKFHPSVRQRKVAKFRGAMGRAVKRGLLGRSAAAQLARAVKKRGTES